MAIPRGPRLQCGHDPEAVETAVGDWTAPNELQCGHDPEAVENDGAVMALHEVPTALQCGHDPEAVESAGRVREAAA